MREGKPVTIDGKQYVASALNLRAVRGLAERKLWALIAQPMRDLTVEGVDAHAAIISASLARRHPEITPDWVLDNVEVHELLPLLSTVMEAIGNREAPAPGESSAPTT